MTDHISVPESQDLATTRASQTSFTDGAEAGAIDIPSFGDFNLDLTCLSAASSPPTSYFGDDDERIPSPTASPSTLHRALSIRSFTPDFQLRPRSISPKPSPSVRTVRGSSMPFTSRLGRGTPVDKNRRFEWGGRLGETSEHGLLFSEPRSTSLDERRARPISPEWLEVTEALLEALSSKTLHGRSRSRSLFVEKTPALNLAGLGAEDTSDWASSTMKTVLDSTVDIRLDDTDTPIPILNFSNSIPGSEGSSDVEPRAPPQTAPEADEAPTAEPPAALPVLPGHRAVLADPDIEVDLGLDSPLDLELKVLEPEVGDARVHSMLHEDLGMDSPSVYSTPPGSVEHRSRASSLPGVNLDGKVGSYTHLAWWRKILRRIRRATSTFRYHANS